ncbi:MAG: aminotransferase class III-fold pyridoxal phosphate-dependent enzyme, partial [Bacteroidales bacterium]|nr:aminotransferase class III-fold pyridoxal phosphate-dependent enzyme [Bacteroidales bacterium]
MIQKISDPPRFPKNDIESFIKEKYGLTADIKPLGSDIGQNFHLIDRQGKEYILKIANNSEFLSILEAQNAVLEHLNKKNTDFRVPALIENLDGEKISEITGQNGIPHKVRLLSFLPGEFLSNISPHTQELLKSLGLRLGSLDLSLQNFSHPALYRYWHWDLKNIPDIRPLTDHIQDPAGKRLVNYFLLQFESEVLSKSTQLRKSLIHNDANDHNILVSQENTDSLVNGIIDFGDMVYSHTIFELAVALAYVMLNKTDPLSAALPVIEAYHQILPLEKTEIEVLFYSICARLSLSVTMASYQQSLQPDNEYLSISEKPAWTLLDQLLQINPEKARQSFIQVCSNESEKQKTLPLESILQDRKKYISKSLSISYKKPLKIVRGALQYLYDQSGQTYLDCVNNVCHVGHAHPVVVRAAQYQMAVLNTNTRYLHDYLVQYAKRLTNTLPEPLKVCLFVNSGSEANELALRLASTHTKQKNVIVIDHAYHGNTPSLIDISPYKYDGKGGRGPGAFTNKVLMPDVYRGPYKSSDPEAGKKYAAHIKETIGKLHEQNKGLAAFIGESLPGCGGQIVFPEGYLENVYQMIRNNGGVCIADEVQVGFGRVGTHFWGFELQNVIPDIVTMGKPIGNGHPLAAVVCTPEIADSFVAGMEYFNTFGGNPVSCATGMAVLDVIKEDNLQENARNVGSKMIKGFKELKNRHPIIGDVRGSGLFIGLELVTNLETLNPATNEAAIIIET